MKKLSLEVSRRPASRCQSCDVIHIQRPQSHLEMVAGMGKMGVTKLVTQKLVHLFYREAFSTHRDSQETSKVCKIKQLANMKKKMKKKTSST